MRTLLHICALSILLMQGSAVAEGIFIHSESEASGRLAILDDDQRVAFLYLTHPGTQKPAKDAVAYMRVSPTVKNNWKEQAKAGEPPLISLEYATPETVVANPSAKDFSFRWAKDGNSVVLEYKGRPIALASASEKHGYSRAVSKESALANPWSDSVYQALFGK